MGFVVVHVVMVVLSGPINQLRAMITGRFAIEEETQAMNRRSWLIGAMASVGAAMMTACDKVTQAPATLRMLRVAEKWNQNAQRLIIGRHALAREFAEADISRDFRANGTHPSGGPGLPDAC